MGIAFLENESLTVKQVSLKTGLPLSAIYDHIRSDDTPRCHYPNGLNIKHFYESQLVELVKVCGFERNRGNTLSSVSGSSIVKGAYSLTSDLTQHQMNIDVDTRHLIGLRFTPNFNGDDLILESDANGHYGWRERKIGVHGSICLTRYGLELDQTINRYVLDHQKQA